MPISDRIEGSIENWSVRWGDRLKAFLTAPISFGMELFFDVLGRSFAPKLKPFLDIINLTGKVPPELQPLLDELENPTGEVAAMLGQSASGALVGGAVGKVLDGLLLPLAYGVNQVTNNVILTEGQYMTLLNRGVITLEFFTNRMKWLGHSDEDIAHLTELNTARLDPNTVSRFWLRDKANNEKYWLDVAAQGVTPDRIAVMKELAHVLPTPQELTAFMAHEVFEDEIATEYGLDDDFDKVDLTWFEKVGISPKIAAMYWRNHWQHPSFNQVTEMLHRGILTENQVWKWFSLVEIPPKWRQDLIDMAWNVPTRVDVRRFWDMRTIDEARLREVYTAQGYHGQDLDDYVLWTKVYVAFPDLISRFKNGWISENDVRTELTGLGMSPERLEEMIQTKIKPEAPERTTNERDLTKTDIYKGVKKGLLTRAEGEELLQSMGYSPDEAVFIIDLNVPIEDTAPEVELRALTKTDILNAFRLKNITEPEAIEGLVLARYSPINAQFLVDIIKKGQIPPEDVHDREVAKTDVIKAVKKGILDSEEGYLMLQNIGFTPQAAQFILEVQATVKEGSPDNLSEFKRLTQVYRKSQGLTSKPVSQELIDAERASVAAKAAFDSADRSGVTGDELGLLKRKVDGTGERYHQLLERYNTPNEEASLT